MKAKLLCWFFNASKQEEQQSSVYSFKGFIKNSILITFLPLFSSFLPLSLSNTEQSIVNLARVIMKLLLELHSRFLIRKLFE